MPTPQHLQRAVEDSRRLPNRVVVTALIATLGIGLLLVSALRGDDDGPQELAGDDPAATAPSTTTTTQPPTSTTSTTEAPSTTTTTTEPTTTTTAASSPSGAPGWYAVIQSAPKSGADRDELEDAVAPYGEQGRVIDTDDYRTGDGQAPDYYPAPGVLAAVVGPFGSRADVQTWCASHGGDQGCHARQILPR